MRISPFLLDRDGPPSRLLPLATGRATLLREKPAVAPGPPTRLSGTSPSTREEQSLVTLRRRSPQFVRQANRPQPLCRLDRRRGLDRDRLDGARQRAAHSRSPFLALSRKCRLTVCFRWLPR